MCPHADCHAVGSQREGNSSTAHESGAHHRGGAGQWGRSWGQEMQRVAQQALKAALSQLPQHKGQEGVLMLVAVLDAPHGRSSMRTPRVMLSSRSITSTTNKSLQQLCSCQHAKALAHTRVPQQRLHTLHWRTPPASVL